MKSNTPIKIVIAEDHEIYRVGLGTALNDNHEFEIAAICKDGEELLRAVQAHQPDIVLTDLKMPKIKGEEAIRIITEKHPAIRCLVLSNFDNEFQIIEALNAGAAGYILKSSPMSELSVAMHQVYKGGEYYCKTTTKKLMRLGIKKLVPRHNAKIGLFTDIEKNIIHHICEDKTCEEIGLLLHMSKRTVENHRGKIYGKMQVTTVAGIAIYAVRHSLYFVADEI